jgi:hypothetical protein
MIRVGESNSMTLVDKIYVSIIIIKSEIQWFQFI